MFFHIGYQRKLSLLELPAQMQVYSTELSSKQRATGFFNVGSTVNKEERIVRVKY